jgi:hypothetical protein
MMTEGVHAGSGGPTFYSSQELENYHWTWNGVPVSIDHPQDDCGSPISCNDPQVYNKQVVGKIFNTVFVDGKLKAEAWLRVSVLNALGGDVINVLDSGDALEVSTGLFCDAQELTGDWNGETYNAVATNIRPDHLALLPGGVGACSWSDGCGIRANKVKEDDMKKESFKENGSLEFNGEPVEVVIKETVETVNNNKQEEGMAKTMQECCPKKVDELIDNNDNFTEDDREVLLGLTEDAFAMVINKAKPIEKKEEEPEKNEEDVTTNEQTNETEEGIKKMTFDEILANADPEVAESIRNGHRIFQNKKTELVQKILAHETNSFTEDELKKFAFDHLEKLASFIPEKKPTNHNYVGNVGSYTPVDNEDPSDGVLPDMDFDFTSDK